MRGASAAAALLLAACASGVILTATVSKDRSLELQLHNRSSQPIGYNLCASSLERRSEGRWQPVASQRMCTMELRSLPPGEAASYRIPIADLPGGEYRAKARLDGPPAEVATEPFVIR